MYLDKDYLGKLNEKFMTLLAPVFVFLGPVMGTGIALAVKTSVEFLTNSAFESVQVMLWAEIYRSGFSQVIKVLDFRKCVHDIPMENSFPTGEYKEVSWTDRFVVDGQVAWNDGAIKESYYEVVIKMFIDANEKKMPLSKYWTEKKNVGEDLNAEKNPWTEDQEAIMDKTIKHFIAEFAPETDGYDKDGEQYVIDKYREWAKTASGNVSKSYIGTIHENKDLKLKAIPERYIKDSLNHFGRDMYIPHPDWNDGNEYCENVKLAIKQRALTKKGMAENKTLTSYIVSSDVTPAALKHCGLEKHSGGSKRVTEKRTKRCRRKTMKKHRKFK